MLTVTQPQLADSEAGNGEEGVALASGVEAKPQGALEAALAAAAGPDAPCPAGRLMRLQLAWVGLVGR